MASLFRMISSLLTLVFTKTAIAQRSGGIGGQDVPGINDPYYEGSIPLSTLLEFLLTALLISFAIQFLVSKVFLKKHVNHSFSDILMISFWWLPVSGMIIIYNGW
jgi:hypothetical protein